MLACCLSVVTCGTEWNSYSVSGCVRQNLNLRSLDIDLSSDDRSGRDKSVRVRYRYVLVISYRGVANSYQYKESVGHRKQTTISKVSPRVEGRSADDAADQGSRIPCGVGLPTYLHFNTELRWK